MASSQKLTPRMTLVQAACRRFPDAGNRTLAKALHEQHPFQFKSLENARNAVRDYHGNMGKASVRQANARGTFRPGRKPGELPPLPTSEAKEWLPYELDARRVLVLSDLHLPHHSVEAIELALAFGDTFKPDAVLLNGDVFDFYMLSRFDKNTSALKVSGELDKGRELFAHLRQRYPRAKLVFKLGNHDERWAKYINDVAPLLADVPGIMDGWQGAAGIHANKVDVVGDHRPVMLGKLPVLHGHELGRGISSPVNPARGAFLRAHHTILVGHSHQTSSHADTNLWHSETQCWSTGCLCTLTPDYARVNRWNMGFAAVEVHKNGGFDVSNMRIANGAVRKS
jgi:predicted phosphodiesterase